MQSNSTQRLCVCQSQFWSLLNGCLACYVAHGAGPNNGLGSVSKSSLSSLSSAYCAASATPSQGLFEVVYSLAPTNAVAPSATSSYSDPMGSKTEVSYYYTPSVTGTAAWMVAQATGMSMASFTTTNIMSGQIVPTAVPTVGKASGTSSGAGATSSAGSPGRHGAMAAAGLFGIAGAVAIL